MNAMEALTKSNCLHQPLIPSFNHRRPPFSRPISSLSFRAPASLSIRASSSSPQLSSSRGPESEPLKTLKAVPFSLVRTASIAAITAAALFLARFQLKPAIANPISPPPTVETASAEADSGEEREKSLEEQLKSNPDDIETLRTLMEVKIMNRKVTDAIKIIEHLMKLQPHDKEWPLLKSHMHIYSDDLESAKKGFNELLEKDPSFVEAYHGLVVAAAQDEAAAGGEELNQIEQRMEERMKILAAEENKNNDLRGFKLLIAQIRVINGDFKEALKIYQQLVKEEPKDFRPYLCQGMIYTLLRKRDEAEKSFEKYRSLVPEEHPYAPYFDDNVIATKLFGQKLENEEARRTKR